MNAMTVDARIVMPNGGVERRARRRLRLTLYPSRVRSNDLLGGLAADHNEDILRDLYNR
jgi:hypothetical protein